MEKFKNLLIIGTQIFKSPLRDNYSDISCGKVGNKVISHRNYIARINFFRIYSAEKMSSEMWNQLFYCFVDQKRESDAFDP